jgi:hypothetical protein
MEIGIYGGTDVELHVSDLYYEKKPGLMEYQLRYCTNGYIVFRPFHSYILPIWEYSTQNIVDLEKNVSICSKLKHSSIFMNNEDEEGILKWSIEYINTTDLWTFDIKRAVIKMKVDRVTFVDRESISDP